MTRIPFIISLLLNFSSQRETRNKGFLWKDLIFFVKKKKSLVPPYVGCMTQRSTLTDNWTAVPVL